MNSWLLKELSVASLKLKVKKLLPGWLEIIQLAHDGDNARKEENTLFKEYEE